MKLRKSKGYRWTRSWAWSLKTLERPNGMMKKSHSYESRQGEGNESMESESEVSIALTLD
jgi:hypothetical protein